METFAYSYYQFRPVEHNRVSEWNYLYNKAHNEYLNYLATTGILGLGSYLLLIISTLYIFIRNSSKIKDLKLLNIGLLSGYIAIIVANFFGFSVVAVALLFFLFPAISIASTMPSLSENKFNFNKITINQKATLVVILLTTSYLLLTTSKYWYADFVYAKSVKFEKQGDIVKAANNAEFASFMFPNEATYTEQLASVYSELTLTANQNSMSDETKRFTKIASDNLNLARQQAPRNIKIMKAVSNSFSDLAELDTNFLSNEFDVLENLIKIAPTDAGIWYRYGLIYAKLGQNDKAVEILNKTIEMKPDYKIARQLLAFIYTENKDYEKAKAEFEYILEKISPNDKAVLEELEKLETKK